jgi:hypothetical protein
MNKIEKYIHTFDLEYRTAVCDQIMQNRLIKEALDTPQGNLLLKSISATIADKARAIVHCCTIDSKKDQADRMQRLATEIHVAFNLMKDWAKILIAGEQHEEAMEKNPKTGM